MNLWFQKKKARQEAGFKSYEENVEKGLQVVRFLAMGGRIQALPLGFFRNPKADDHLDDQQATTETTAESTIVVITASAWIRSWLPIEYSSPTLLAT